MKPRENMMAIFNREQPDYYGDFMAALDFAPDPVFAADSVPDDGVEHRDSWGTVCVKLPGSPGKHPHVTPENAVVKDVTAWREQLKVPALEGLDWSAAREFAAGADRSERFVGLFSAQGLFERSHFLMGMEDAFCAYLEEPDDMADLLRAIADYKIAVLRECRAPSGFCRPSSARAPPPRRGTGTMPGRPARRRASCLRPCAPRTGRTPS